DDGGDCLAIFVVANNGLQIQVSEDIAVEDNGGFANQILGKFVCSGSAHRLRLDRVLKLHPKLGTVAELLFDLLRLIRKRERDVGDTGAAESIDLIKQKRTIADRNDRFRRVARQGRKPWA